MRRICLSRQYWTQGKTVGFPLHANVLLILHDCCRFKLLDFPGMDARLRAKAQRFLRANYRADWAPWESTETESSGEDTDVVVVNHLVPQQPKKQSALALFLADDEEPEETPVPEQPVAPRDEVEEYLKLPQASSTNPDGSELDILSWWKIHEEQLPHLSKMARQFLALPASSAGAERIFTAAGKRPLCWHGHIKLQTLL